MRNTKEKVLKEVHEEGVASVEGHDKFTLDYSEEDISGYIDKTLAEVGKVIDEKISFLEKKWKDIHIRALDNRSPDIEEIYNKTALPRINEIKEQIKLLEELKKSLGIKE